MPMPEAAVNKDHSLAPREYEIGTPRKLGVQAKAKPESMQVSPDDQLGFRVSISNGRHHPTAGGGIYDVHESPPLRRCRELPARLWGGSLRFLADFLHCFCFVAIQL